MADLGKIKFRYRLEYVVLVATEHMFRILPYKVGICIAWVLARIAFHVIRFRRREAVRRIKQVFGASVTDREANCIAYLSIRNLFFNVAELLCLRNISVEWIKRHYVCDVDKVVAEVNAVRCDGHGVIMALPHLGNWDLTGILVAFKGIPIFAVSGVQHNPLTNDWINRKRATGMTILERGTFAIRHILKHLRNGEVMAILPDVRMKTPDLSIRFLGANANIGRGMALFARMTGSPIMLARICRIGIWRHSVAVDAPVYPDMSLDEKADVQRMTELIMGKIEDMIRQNPDQWFWYNKRWILDPLESK